MNSETDHDYQSFLEDEVALIRRSNRQTLFLGAIFSVAMIVYMTVILKMVEGFLDPTVVANNISWQMEQQTPVFIKDAELKLKREAPKVAEGISQTFLKSIPQLREAAEAQIDLCQSEMIPHLSVDLQDMITSYIQENQDELKALAEAHNADEDFARKFTQTMLAELGEQLDNTMKSDFEGRDITYFKQNVMAGLLALNEHLNTLATTTPEKLDYRLRLQRKIIASLINKLTSSEYVNTMIELELPPYLK